MNLSFTHKENNLLLKINTWILNIQNSNSPTFDLIILFHDFAIIIIVTIIIIIFFIISIITKNKLTNRFLLQGHLIELIWTIAPIFILILIAFPSLKVLYICDDMRNPKITIKCIAHQWYWSYEYTDFHNIDFNSFILPSTLNNISNFRLLDVDNRCILPYLINIRLITTSTDVIHSWTVPSLGIKIDSSPGRLNQTHVLLCRPGLFFGQCSEICGINHRFIPIVIESTNFTFFKKWIQQILIT